MIYLEEFGNIGVLPGVQKKMAQLRSYGIGFFLVLQNLAQLADNYGEAAARGIVANCWSRLCLGGIGTDDAEAFSALGGTETVLSASQGDTRAITRLPWWVALLELVANRSHSVRPASAVELADHLQIALFGLTNQWRGAPCRRQGRPRPARSPGLIGR